MSIELLPLTSFALESCALPDPVAGEPQTLTLQLALSTRRIAEPMAGTIAPIRTRGAGRDTERAAIAPADASAITITFA